MQEKLQALKMIFNVSVRMTAIVLVCSAQYLLGENNGCHFAFNSRERLEREKRLYQGGERRSKGRREEWMGQ